MDQKVDAASLVRELGIAARAAARDLARASTETKNRALAAMAAEIRRSAQAILAANAGDVAQAGADGREAAVRLVASADREAVGALSKLHGYVDIIGPRGGKELIERLARESQIPMIKHLDGVCHVYVDDEADAEMAVKIADNAKTQRYG